jgi:hypothetical protein
MNYKANGGVPNRKSGGRCDALIKTEPTKVPTRHVDPIIMSHLSVSIGGASRGENENENMQTDQQVVQINKLCDATDSTRTT